MQGGFGRLEVASGDRILVLSPHPDDASACAGLIQKALKEGAEVRLVYLTFGDERIFRPLRGRVVLRASAVRRLAATRKAEALDAAKALGLGPERLTFLGYPVRQALELWLRHWRAAPALRSRGTGTDHVPYPDAHRPGARHDGEHLLDDLKAVILEFRPNKVFVSHPADRHPDHRALHLFARVALWDLEGQLKAEVLPFLVHYGRWPKPRGYYPAASLNPPEPLYHATRWLKLPLDEGMVRAKRAAVEAHRTRVDLDPYGMRSAVKCNELFGDLPAARFPPEGSFTPFLSGEIRTAGIEFASAALKGGNLVLRVRLLPSLVAVGGVRVHVYGHRAGTPFASMPKLAVAVGRFGRRVTDLGRRLPGATVALKRRGRDVELTFPLSALGGPERILVSARATAGPVVLGRECWRVLERPAPRKSEPETLLR